jgi:hypothetical protein
VDGGELPKQESAPRLVGVELWRPQAATDRCARMPAVAYCRYEDDFTLVVKRTKAHAQEVREARRAFLEGKLKLTWSKSVETSKV